MKLTVDTKILIWMGGRMVSTRIMLISPSGDYVFLGARATDTDCALIGWRRTVLLIVAEVLERPNAANAVPEPEPATHY
ncbi:MAG: hypothetical protein QM715_15725 [Nibricoccus sp.]